MRILVINGPNINLLGTREPHIYGEMTYADFEKELSTYCESKHVEVEIRQTNLEGIIIDMLHYAQHEAFDAVILNAAAFTHYAYAIYDAIKAISVPVVEVHFTDPETREEAFRKHSVITNACEATFKGNHIRSYFDAIDFLTKRERQ